MTNIKLLEDIKKYRTISIIGMDKNVGKTTVLNHLLKETRGKYSLGLTSIGRDGEDKDRVTYTEKPRIYVEKGTFIATAKQCMQNGDITREIINTTGINTPMGEIVVIKALSDGYIELGGPPINSYMAKICDELLKLGSSMVLVDGALSRKTSASPAITDAAILSTGASLARSMETVVNMTSHAVKLLSLEQEKDEEVRRICIDNDDSVRVMLIDREKKKRTLAISTSLEASKEIVESLNDKVKYVFIKGIMSDKLINDIIKSTDKFKSVVFLIQDGTKAFVSSDTLYKFEKIGGKIRVIDRINMICVTCNPKSPYGYEFDKDRFLEKLRKKIELPVYDIVGGD